MVTISCLLELSSSRAKKASIHIRFCGYEGQVLPAEWAELPGYSDSRPVGDAVFRWRESLLAASAFDHQHPRGGQSPAAHRWSEPVAASLPRACPHVCILARNGNLILSATDPNSLAGPYQFPPRREHSRHSSTPSKP